MKRLSVVLLALLIGIACAPRQVKTASAAPGESRLSVYLQAFPEETDRLTFRIRAVTLVREDAHRLPLTLHLDEVSGRILDRERLLASGGLIAGAYAGLEIEIAQATLGRGNEKNSLAVGPDPVRVDLPFVIGRRKGLALTVRFDPTDSIREGFSFEAAFSGQIPARPPTGVVALASSRASDSVTIFDKISGRVIALIPTGRRPSGMVLAAMTRRVYVALEGDDSVEVIGIDEQDVIERIRLQGGDAPREVVLTPDGKTLLSANTGSDSVSFIDPSGPFETDRVAVGNGPNSILVDPGGRRAYVFNSRGDSVSILDLPRRAVIATIRTESEPLRGQLSPEGDRLYVIHRSSPNMLVIDTATLNIVDRIYIRSGASALKIDDRTGWIYLATRSGDSVEVFEPDSFLPVGNINVRGEVNYLTIDGETGNLFCVMPRSPGVRSVSTASQRTVTDVDLGADPYWVTMMGER